MIHDNSKVDFMMMKMNASFLWMMLMIVSLGIGGLNAQEVSRTFEVSSFNMVDSDIVGNVIYTQSEEGFSVEAEGDEELVENLRVEVNDKRLILRDEKKTGRKLIGRFRAKKLTVRISSPELVRIQSDGAGGIDRKSIRLNSSHVAISYAVFCLKKKT